MDLQLKAVEKHVIGVRTAICVGIYIIFDQADQNPGLMITKNINVKMLKVFLSTYYFFLRILRNIVNFFQVTN